MGNARHILSEDKIALRDRYDEAWVMVQDGLLTRTFAISIYVARRASTARDGPES
jgi:hypothetical protein